MAACLPCSIQSPQNHVRSLGSVVSQGCRTRVDGTGPPCTAVFDIEKLSAWHLRCYRCLPRTPGLRGGLKPEQMVPNGMIREILIPDTCLPFQDDLIQIHRQAQSVSASCEHSTWPRETRNVKGRGGPAHNLLHYHWCCCLRSSSGILVFASSRADPVLSREFKKFRTRIHYIGFSCDGGCSPSDSLSL